MQRCNKIYNHPLFRECMKRIEENEKDRPFCLHNLNHSFDCARIGYIMILERGLNIDKELFYAAALLHDMGRYTGVPHHISGAELAKRIMPECGFTDDETAVASNAISGHRSNSSCGEFADILFEADKKSRLCFMCKAAKDCYWSEEKRNLNIEI